MVADDLVQETMVVALQRIGQLRDRGRLNAWMYTILSNGWKQHLRQMRPTVDIDDAELAGEGDAESRCCEQKIVAHVRRSWRNCPLVNARR